MYCSSLCAEVDCLAGPSLHHLLKPQGRQGRLRGWKQTQGAGTADISSLLADTQQPQQRAHAVSSPLVAGPGDYSPDAAVNSPALWWSSLQAHCAQFTAWRAPPEAHAQCYKRDQQSQSFAKRGAREPPTGPAGQLVLSLHRISVPCKETETFRSNPRELRQVREPMEIQGTLEGTAVAQQTWGQ